MKWFMAFLLTLLLCFSVISYSSADTIEPFVQPTFSFGGSIFGTNSTWLDAWNNSDDQASVVLDYWNEVSTSTQVTGSTGDVNVSHNPIPPAVWLLSSGLIGIVALRRKFKN